MDTVKKNRHDEPVMLLGIESSGLTCALGVSQDRQVIVEISANIRNIHSEKLGFFFEQVLATAGINKGDLHGIVLSAGPGSFTGLRIGYSFAKGLAYALNIPIVEVPTLDVWAYQSGTQTTPLMPVIDAHRREIFTALYRWERATLKLEKAHTLLALESIPKFLSGPVTVCGTDSLKLKSHLKPYLPKGSTILQPAAASPLLWALFELGFQKYQQRCYADLPQAEPFYLRAFRGVS